MHWGWMILSAVMGATYFLWRVAAANRKSNEEVILSKPAPVLLLGGLGAGCGWFALYYAPLTLYRGGASFLILYNDPSNPLLPLIPRLVGAALALAFAYGGVKAWRSSVKAQKERLNRLSTQTLFLSLALWLAALGVLAIGIYISLKM